MLGGSGAAGMMSSGRSSGGGGGGGRSDLGAAPLKSLFIETVKLTPSFSITFIVFRAHLHVDEEIP